MEALLVKLKEECASNDEYKSVSADGAVELAFTLLAQASYMASSRVRNEQALPDAEANTHRHH